MEGGAVIVSQGDMRLRVATADGARRMRNGKSASALF
jgi:hypothetical protein